MKIVVTEEDITNGKRHAPYSCPIALAIQRATGYSILAVYPKSGGRGAVRIGYKIIPIPMAVNQAIMKFDSENKMEPFEFELPYKL